MERWEREEAEKAQLRAENAALRAENAELRASRDRALAILESHVESMRASHIEDRESQALMDDVLRRCQLVRRGEDLPEDVWDEATAAQAEEEMRRASVE